MGDGDYILFYSNRCLHCKELLTLLYKDVELNQKFIKINIDTGNVKIPPYVKSVPTAIIPQNGSPGLLVGSAIFKWYNQRHSKNVEQQGIMDWDPHTMSGFSDGFSYLDDNNKNVIKRSFAFIADSHSITAPDEGKYQDNRGNGRTSNSKSDLKQQEFDKDFERFMSQRKNEVPATIPKI